MAISIRHVTIFNNLEWWDKKSGGSYDGAYWAPQVPAGYYPLGSLGTNNYDNPSNKGHNFFVVRAASDPAAIAHPTDYQLIWTDRGSGSSLDGSMWLPLPPPGYVALGAVANRGYGKPSLNEVACVKQEYTVPGKIGAFIWNDRRTGSKHDFGSWLIDDQPDDKPGIAPGTFIGVTSHNPPASNPACNCLSAAHVSGPPPPTLHELHTMVNKYGPIYRIHPEEPYLPTSVEWFVPRCTLVNNVTGERRTGITPDSLPTKGDYRLEVNNPSTYRGDFSQAKVYVHAKAVDVATTDIQFWFFYAYNGSGTAHFKTFTFGGASLHSGNATLKPLGEHQGDWEHITVRFDNMSHLPESVCFSQHGDGHWVPWNDVEKHGDQVIVYASLNGHASYPHAGDNYTEHRKYPDTNWTPLGLDFKLRNATATGPTVLDGSRKYEIVNADYLGASAPSVPNWVNFRGRYGKHEDANISSEAIQSVLRGILGPFLSVATNLNIFTALGKSLLKVFVKEDQDGPTAPISKNVWNGDE